MPCCREFLRNRFTQETKTVGSTQSSISYTWDSNGNLKSKTLGESQTTFYAWNSDQRLTAVKQGTSEATAITVAQYSYDLDGNRTQKVEPGQNGNPDKITNYLVDRSYTYAQSLQETVTLGANSTITNYVWGNGLIAQSRAGQNSYYHADGLGSVKALTDAAGITTDAYVYDAFGTVEGHSGASDNAYRYTGEYFDDTIQLQYNRARWYDTAVGRFNGMDTHSGSMAQPITLHDYVYANNDPINVTDPSGQMGLMDVGGVASNIVAGFATRAQVAFQTGKQAGGAAVRALGRVVERRVQEMIRQCFKGDLKKHVPVSGSGGNRKIDFLLDLKDRTQLLEVK
ncbi:RHS repeat-associated core domain-containing protein [Undibacterium seohonense]|uniref:RHS repeat-associated core domain-containing protein n=1 Tax=Undibacterium seohonense TaxID=1344950 RepID=A0ABR6X8X2_9BURK|nr:RHS repeat-associated core domain-containing protein [Undibacterium seohonense]MBC3809312.1 RHS repeat-associated core domain-containing protein [Undibacterium seohonense]